MTTPLDIAVQRELADLRDEITRRPPALVSLDTLDRLATAVEGVAQALTTPAQPEPIGWVTVWRLDRTAPWASDGTIHTDLDTAREEYAAACDRYPLLETRLVALVPVVTP